MISTAYNASMPAASRPMLRPPAPAKRSIAVAMLIHAIPEPRLPGRVDTCSLRQNYQNKTGTQVRPQVRGGMANGPLTLARSVLGTLEFGPPARGRSGSRTPSRPGLASPAPPAQRLL